MCIMEELYFTNEYMFRNSFEKSVSLSGKLSFLAPLRMFPNTYIFQKIKRLVAGGRKVHRISNSKKGKKG